MRRPSNAHFPHSRQPHEWAAHSSARARGRRDDAVGGVRESMFSGSSAGRPTLSLREDADADILRGREGSGRWYSSESESESESGSWCWRGVSECACMREEGGPTRFRFLSGTATDMRRGGSIAGRVRGGVSGYWRGEGGGRPTFL